MTVLVALTRQKMSSPKPISVNKDYALRLVVLLTFNMIPNIDKQQNKFNILKIR